jgi:hypothetical protein
MLTERMDEHRIAKRLLEMKMSGRRIRARRNMPWIDQVKRDVERRGGDWRTVMDEDCYAEVDPQVWK